MSPKVHPRGLSRILSKTGFGSVLNISASLANPMKPGLAVRGVYAREMILPVARTLRSIGFDRAMVMHGESGHGARGMDEFSPLGRTWVAELLPDGKILEYRVLASDFGIVPQDAELLAGGGSPGEEAFKILDILSGRDQGVRLHTVGLNAAPVLLLAGLARDLGQGYEKSLEAIRSGAALEKLQAWVVHQNRKPSTGGKTLARLLGARHRV